MNRAQKLKNIPEYYKSDNYTLECTYSDELNKFCLWFNGSLFTYKTAKGMDIKKDYFIKKYNLK